ncbi:MAG: ATP-dependent helicase, partial [Anaerolineales bacterium]|nr:ATP-dependent helicase [Anaerolineales bacterium]
QDSSRLQEEILRLLAGHGNWVRVGDPNQAIYETFTTANPAFLRNFLSSEADQCRELPVSGRSQPLILELANFLIDWTNQAHPAEACRDALSPPYIRPTDPDDPQPNPPFDLEAVQILTKKYTPDEEIQVVVASLKKWLPSHPDWTVAILTPRNTRGFEVVEALKKENIPTVELISSTDETRRAAGALGNLLAYLSDPGNPSKLALAYQVWRRDWRKDKTQHGLYRHVAEHLRKLKQVESYLNPLSFSTNEVAAEEEEVAQELEAFRQKVRFWQDAVLLPIDQLILTLAQDLFTEPSDLALAHKLALVLKQTAESHSDWRLPELSDELVLIARNERRFLGFSNSDSGFDPEAHRGKVVVATIHKSKGLEWDRVYLISVNNYDFPSLQPSDRYIAEKWFVRSRLNLQAEALAQLRTLLFPNEFGWYEEGHATLESRIEYVRERLRLLYVGITRAKRELIITWNSGRQGDLLPALPLRALAGWLQRYKHKR